MAKRMSMSNESMIFHDHNADRKADCDNRHDDSEDEKEMMRTRQ